MLSYNEVSVRSPDGLRTIYASNKLDKEGSSLVLMNFGESNLVTTLDSSLHLQRRKMLSSIYAAPKIIAKETQAIFRDHSGRFLERIEAEKSQEGVCNVFPMLRCLAVDIVSHIVLGSTYSLDTLRNTQHRQEMNAILRPADRTPDVKTLVFSWYPGRIIS